MEDNKINNITILSYNSTGFSVDKQIFINILLSVLKNNTPILCGQEHFIQSGNKKTKHLLQKVITAFPGFKCFASPAINANSEVIGGRAKGGLWICWPQDLDTYVKRIKTTHWRVQAVIFDFEYIKICLINVYHLTDPKIVNEDEFNDDELNGVFRAIDKIRTKEEFDELIIAGDRNADFDRINAFVNKVKRFDNERNLQYSWNKFDIDYTHIHTDDISTDRLDHFMWTNGLSDHIIDGGVLHLNDNLSRHSPIWIKLNVKNIVRNTEEEVKIAEEIAWAIGSDPGVH